jgi:hypothetical protein
MRVGIATGALLAGVLTGCGRHTGADLVWRATTDEASRVQVASDGERVVVEVWSGTGIGHAHVERIDGKRTREVLLRLHLQGLERLRVDYGKVVELSLSSTAPYTWSCTLVSGGSTVGEVDADSPYWMPVRLVAADGGLGRIPLREGTIEVGLPRDVLAGKSRSFDFDWIDFYR